MSYKNAGEPAHAFYFERTSFRDYSVAPYDYYYAFQRNYEATTQVEGRFLREARDRLMLTRPELYNELLANTTVQQSGAAESDSKGQFFSEILLQYRYNAAVSEQHNQGELEKQLFGRTSSSQTRRAQEDMEAIQRIGSLHGSSAACRRQEASFCSTIEQQEGANMLFSQKVQTTQAGFFRPSTPFFGLNRTVTELSESSSEQQGPRIMGITRKGSGVNLVARAAEARGERGRALFGGSSYSETSSIDAVDNWSAIQVESRSRVFSGEFQLLRTPRQDAIKKTGMRAESMVLDALDSAQNSSESGASSRVGAK